MHDPNAVASDPEAFSKHMRERGTDPGLIDQVVRLNERRRSLQADYDRLRQEQRAIGQEIGRLKQAGGAAAAIIAEQGQRSQRIKELEKQHKAVGAALEEVLEQLPNLADSDVPVGEGEESNVLVRAGGEKRQFDFPPRPHYELAPRLGLVDFERGARMSGSGFFCLTGDGARLQRALINWFLDEHRAAGFREIMPPYLVNRRTLWNSGQLPKYAEQMYHAPLDDLFLIPTAEVPLTALHAEEEIPSEALPLRYCAFSPCFRREAGAAGLETRGMVRVHQFDKVEMYAFVRPEDSPAELEKMTRAAESLLERLGLHYRRLLLCTGELGFAAAKTYDLEAWAPGAERWLEVSSCSNARDFQARRARLRFRDQEQKLRYLHTLNGSGLALPRAFIALLETHQQADGSVIVPEVLRPYLDGQDKLGSP